MSEDTVTLEVDGKTLKARKGAMLIEATDDAGIYVPRFCYHKKLSIAANCRMCLVEVEKAPKPLPACATPVAEGMKVFTRSPFAKEAQKATMEFLLINHPLDCPICDQGGECELQDLALGYGGDVSRYTERKRVVKDKNIGPLIHTDMTRCIHCTRCVRFGEEIAGLRELGATGRGEYMEIGTYIERAVTSELSGNVIDLCPVGALTSKPYRYSARAWELRQCEGVAPHDCIGSNIHIHVKGDRVKRVVPKENEAINETWISDRDRYSYEGLYSADRLSVPLIREHGGWRESDWETALNFAAQGLRRLIEQYGPEQLACLSTPSATVEELYLLQKLARGLGCPNLDHRLLQTDFSDQEKAPLFPWLGQPIADLERVEAALLIGCDPRREQPIANHRLRKAVLRGARVAVLNPVGFGFNFELTEGLVVPPSQMVAAAAGITKAVLQRRGPNVDAMLAALLADMEVAPVHEEIAGLLTAGKEAAVVLGEHAINHPQFSLLRFLAGSAARLSGARLGYLPEAANSCGAWLAGMLPHREAGGETATRIGLHAQAMFAQARKGYILFGLEPERDLARPMLALNALQAAEFVLAFSAYRTPAIERYAHLVLPIGLFAESPGTYVNAAGDWQSFGAAVPPLGEARPGWKILRMLGKLCGLPGFDHVSVEQITEEVRSKLGAAAPVNEGSWVQPAALPRTPTNGLELVYQRPSYSLDPLLRRAPALQQMQAIAYKDGISINPRLAQALSLGPGVEAALARDGAELVLPVAIDRALPDNTVLLRLNRELGFDLGISEGSLTLEPHTAAG
ncbi:MAG: NADH-quinone oxidoreductase subunit NuoG, partial [Gammaproteobacteria bacterium]